MSDYGVTPKGIVIKRLDEITEELHTDLSDGFGYNTRFNPKSFLNVLLTNFADKISELWEVGEKIYHSMYPYSAEDINLDNAIQYGGITREEARPTFYPIHCECVDGTVIPEGMIIRSNTNPAVQLVCSNNTTVTRSSFNRVKIRIAALQSSAIYSVALNGTVYSYTSEATDGENEILTGLERAVTDDKFHIKQEDGCVSITAADVQTSNQLVLSGNLTTQSVTGIVNFASLENGEIVLPNETITQIATAVPGLLSVINLVPYIAGRLLQTDVELRRSYIDKIYHRSNRMLESIKSALLLNVQGINAVAVYQNDTNIIDEDGRWAHSVEVVIDGGSDYEIALQIWDKKTDGIQTFGNTEVIVPGDEGEPVTIRFNRPEYVYVWFSVEITMSKAEPLPPNYVEAITSIILNEMESIEPGKPIIPQRLIEAKIYGGIPGIAYIETKTFFSADKNEQPSEYVTGLVPITPRQRAVTDEARITVILGE